jgi:hypothetical protein
MGKVRNWIKGSGIIIIIGFIVMLGINYSVMTISDFWPFDGENLLSFDVDNFSYMLFTVFTMVLRIALYVSIAAIVFAIISLFRHRKAGMVISGLLLFVFTVGLLVFQILLLGVSLIGIILVIVSTVLSLILLIMIFRHDFDKDDMLYDDYSENNGKQKKEPKLFEKSKTTATMLVLDIFSVVVLASLFFIPFFTKITGNVRQRATMINVLFSGETDLIVVIVFFVYLVILFITIMLLMNTLAVYSRSDDRFIKQSKRIIRVMFIAVSGFFIAGLVIKIMYSIVSSQDVFIISYIPMFVMFIVYFYNALLIGRIKGYEYNDEKRHIPFYNIEPLVFLVLITLVTVGMMFLPVIRIVVGSMSYEDDISLTGLDLIQDYAELDGGYQLLAFVLYVMLLVVGFGLILAITAYLSKSKMFHQIVKTVSFTNVFFVFLISISGYYFQIAKEINLELLRNLIDHYNAGFIIDPELYDYEIKTDTMFALFASVAVLIIMFARRIFDRDEFLGLEPGIGPFGGLGTNEPTRSTGPLGLDPESSQEDFDPCYSFTEVDLQKEAYEEDLKQRQAFAPEEASLTSLTKFIVDYARNSRLHLSYTRSNIAAFIAGLGASKLSILQGMSGTGKTSLPKIFSEAILGNCEIVEVESSWKDKNELLGYYNEFSLKYTPKKFTISLYKATLNQDIFTFILLDEMNLSRIEYYFSDFLSLMEHEEDHRKIKLVNLKLMRQEEGEEVEYIALNNGHTLKVPPNIWFIGTANRDESTFVISDKVYDRATTMNFTKRAPKVRNYSDPIPKRFYDYHTINTLLMDAKAKGTFDAEKNETIKAVEVLLSPYNISFGNRILKQIEDFVNVYTECFAGENVEHEAVETILLSKVVAKLEIKTIEDKDQMQLEFEKLNLFQCAEFIKLLDDE